MFDWTQEKELSSEALAKPAAAKSLRVLQIVQTLSPNGIDSVVLNYYQAILDQAVHFDFVVIGEKGVYAQQVADLGSQVYVIPRLTKKPLQYMKQLQSIIQDGEYDVVHVHQDAMSALALWAAKKAGVSVRIAHAHSTQMPLGLRGVAYRFFKRWIPHVATHFFACSQTAGRFFFGEKVLANRPFFVMPNAIDAAQFSFDVNRRLEQRQKLGLGEAAMLIHIGRLDFPKNQQFLIQVFELYLNIDPTAHLYCLGEGPDRSALLDYVQQHGLAEQVHLVGHQTNTIDWLCAADLMVMPSFFEGIPLAALEAQTAGLPLLLSSRIDPDTAFSPQTQFASLADSPAFWMAAIHQLLSLDPDRRIGVTENRRAGYDIYPAAQQLARWYRQFIVSATPAEVESSAKTGSDSAVDGF